MSNDERKSKEINSWYSNLHDFKGEDKSIYEIWESGEALNDSVTPSTYCKLYQSHIKLKLISLAHNNLSVFSIGCGNAFIEAELVEKGTKVIAIDCNAEAVELAKNKGVIAYQIDFNQVDNELLSSCQVIYADGVLGHLFDERTHLSEFEAKISSNAIPPGTKIIISNDSPNDNTLSYQRHNTLDTFWFISITYFEESLKKCGFKVLEKYNFPYLRPISGLRNRAVCIAEKM